jgi:hypothetical protein
VPPGLLRRGPGGGGGGEPPCPAPPPLLLTQPAIGPEAEQDREREVGDHQVAALQPLAPVERQAGEPGTERGVPAKCEHHADGGHQVPYRPLRQHPGGGGRARPPPARAPAGGRQGTRRGQRHQPDVTGHLIEAVGAEERWLAEGARPAEHIGHQRQQQPVRAERPGAEQCQAGRCSLRGGEHRDPRQQLHRSKRGPERHPGQHQDEVAGAAPPPAGQPRPAAAAAGQRPGRTPGLPRGLLLPGFLPGSQPEGPPARVAGNDHHGVVDRPRLTGQHDQAGRRGEHGQPGKPAPRLRRPGQPQQGEQRDRHPAHPGNQAEVGDLGRHGAGEPERQRGKDSCYGREAAGPEEGVGSQPRCPPGDDQVGGPRRHGGQHGEEQRRRVGRGSVPPPQQRRATPDVGVEQRQVTVAKLGSRQYPQRIVLVVVIAGHDRIAREGGQPEHHHRQASENPEGHPVVPVPSPHRPVVRERLTSVPGRDPARSARPGSGPLCPASSPSRRSLPPERSSRPAARARAGRQAETFCHGYRCEKLRHGQPRLLASTAPAGSGWRTAQAPG